MSEKPPDLRKLAAFFQGGAELLASLGKFAAAMAPPPGEEPEDPYRILGVNRGDPPKLIEGVYRAKARVLHPDNKETGDAEAFKRLKAAYDQVRNGGKA